MVENQVLAKTEDKQTPALSFRGLIWVVVLGVAVWLIIPKIIGAKEGLLLLSQAKIGWILFAILLEFVSYIGIAIMIESLTLSLRYKIPFFQVFKIGIISAFAIHVLPVGGFGGIALTFYLLKSKGVKAGDNLLIFILRTILTYFFFGVLLMMSLIYLPSHPNLSLIQRVVIIGINVIAWGVLIYLIYLYLDEIRLRKSSHIWARIINFFSKLFVKRKILNPEKTEEIVSRLYRGTDLFIKQREKVFWGSAGSLIYWIGDIACLALVFLAFGYNVHLGALIFGYTIATILGIVSFIPGGLGVFEGTLSLILISLRVPAQLALISILVFRLISFWLPMIVGFFSFLSFRKELALLQQNGQK